MQKIKIYCVTNKNIEKLEKLNYELAGVGKFDFPENIFNASFEEVYKSKSNTTQAMGLFEVALSKNSETVFLTSPRINLVFESNFDFNLSTSIG